MRLRSVRIDSESHGRVCVVCLFCARQPSCSHLVPCGLFVSAPGARDASALGGVAPKFFRWIHCVPRRSIPRPQPQVQRYLRSSGGSLNKEMLRRSNEALGANDGNIDTAKGCRLCKVRRSGVANRNGYEMTTPADAGFARGWERTSFGSEDHADWMRRASRMLDEDGRAGRGVGRAETVWSWFTHRRGRGWRVSGPSAMRGRVGNRPLDGLAITSSHAYVPGHDDVHRSKRLFSCREAQSTSPEIVEVGDLSCRKTKPDRAVVGLFSHNGGGQ
jgi:hypothetical protein